MYGSLKIGCVLMVAALIGGCAMLGPSDQYSCGYKNLTTSARFSASAVTAAEAKTLAIRKCQAGPYGWHCAFRYCRALAA